MRQSFVKEYESLRAKLINHKRINKPIGQVSQFSQLYYGCGVVFSVVFSRGCFSYRMEWMQC